MTTSNSGDRVDGSRRQVRLLSAGIVVNSLGNGLYLPLSLVLLHSLSGLSLSTIGALLTVAMGDFDSTGLEISGDQAALQQFLGVLDRPDPAFNIITP